MKYILLFQKKIHIGVLILSNHQKKSLSPKIFLENFSADKKN